jgi:hypothetical protein
MGEKETKPKYFKIAGVSFRRPGSKKTGLDIIDQYAGQGAKFQVQREPTNKYDENAVQVRQVFGNGGSVVLGYVPKNLAAEFSPLMDAGEEIPVSFSQKFISKDGECRGLQLKY